MWEGLLITKEPGFEISQIFKMASDARVKKWLASKVQIQGTVGKILSRDEAECGIIKSSGKTSERSKLMPQGTIWSHKRPFKKI